MIEIDYDPQTGRVFATYPAGTGAPVAAGYQRATVPAGMVEETDDAPPSIDLAALAAMPAPVPERVDMWQARAALRLAGLYEAADAAIAASGNPALIEAWTNGNSFRRDSPAIAQLGAALGLTPAQIDDLFRSAAGIAV